MCTAVKMGARMWVGRAPIGSLRFRYADPVSAFVSTFDSGDSPFAQEVNRYFVNAHWVQSRQQTTVLQFGFVHAPEVALAALRLSPPDEVILVLGIARAWQGANDPALPTLRVLDSIVEAVAAFARADGATRLLLRVRAGNLRAIAAYGRNGFREVRRWDDPQHGPTCEFERIL